MNHRPARRARRASAGPLFTPHGTDRATRKAARKQLAEAQAKARETAAAHPSGHQPAEAHMPLPVYPAYGRPGAASARGTRLRLPAHRMTTATASGAYPSSPKAGSAPKASTSAATSTPRRASPSTPSPCTGASRDSPTPTSSWPA